MTVRPISGKRKTTPRVTKADLERTAEFLRLMGAKVATTETTPGKLKVVTTDGANLTLSEEGETLDEGLRKFIQNGHHAA